MGWVRRGLGWFDQAGMVPAGGAWACGPIVQADGWLVGRRRTLAPCGDRCLAICALFAPRSPFLINACGRIESQPTQTCVEPAPVRSNRSLCWSDPPGTQPLPPRLDSKPAPVFLPARCRATPPHGATVGHVSPAPRSQVGGPTALIAERCPSPARGLAAMGQQQSCAPAPDVATPRRPVIKDGGMWHGAAPFSEQCFATPASCFWRTELGSAVLESEGVLPAGSGPQSSPRCGKRCRCHRCSCNSEHFEATSGRMWGEAPFGH